jgi:transposase-like protein
VSDTERLLKSEPVRRVEVFTGDGEQKLGIVAESSAAGETESAIAHRHGPTPQEIVRWRRAAARGTEPRADIR